MKLYLAGPLFTASEREWNIELAQQLKLRGYDIFLPQNIREKKPQKLFTELIAGIDWADRIVANCDGADVDSGTAWEMGYAYATRKKVFYYRTDFRKNSDNNISDINLMLACGAKEIKIDVTPKNIGVGNLAKAIDYTLVYD